MEDAERADERQKALLWHPEMWGFPLMARVEDFLAVLPGMVEVAEQLCRDSQRRSIAEEPLLTDGQRINLERMLMAQLRRMLDEAIESGNWACDHGEARAREWLAGRAAAAAEALEPTH